MWTAAVEYANAPCLELLIQHGADKEARDNVSNRMFNTTKPI